MNRAILRTLATALVAALAGEARTALAQGTITGVVREDSTGKPLTGADISIAALDRRATTDGSGRYTLRDVPAGIRVLHARLVGYQPFSIMLEVPSGATRQQDFVLSRQPTRLDSIVVTAEPKGPVDLRSTFEDRRKMGFGKFMDSTELRRHEHRHLHDVLRGIPGVVVASPPMCGSYRIANCVTSRLVRVAVGGRTRRLSMMMGASNPCFMEIYLNGVLLSRGGDRNWEDAFDLNDINISQLDAVEVYRSAGELPAEFIGTSAACGVIALWAKWGKTP